MSPVPEKFQAYGEAVCAFLSHATRREKAAVRQELMDHLTDHTQALLDAGCPPEAAETRALAAMGEAQEVGQALNQAFPRRWLALSRLALAALGLLLTIVLSYVLPLGDHLQEAWAIRQAPSTTTTPPSCWGKATPWRTSPPWKGRAIPCPMALPWSSTGPSPGYRGQTPRTPACWQCGTPLPSGPQNSLALPTLTVPGEGDLPWSPSDSASYGVYGVYFVPPPQGDTLILEYNHFGTTFSISIPWEEVHP